MTYISREAFLAERYKQYCENCPKRYGMKKGKSVICYEIGDAPCRSCGIGDVLGDVEDFPAADVRPVVRKPVVGYECGASTRVYETDRGAFNAWNRRADDVCA